MISHCRNALDEHSLIVIKWAVYDHSKHATQLMCEKCFKLIDHLEIVNFHTEHHGKHCETSEVDSSLDV